MPLFRKKPVEVFAVQVTTADWNGNTWDGCPFTDVPPWLREAFDIGKITVAMHGETDYAKFDIHTAEGVMRAEPGDWVILGVKGEIYPCKPDVFELTYEAV